ncbi:MAG: hypothetical protein Q8Q09_11385 [Deltaproteobacteria bacterium]|nr:hypothetical protein [Deltaproteobacteria bacterium]
MTPPGASQRSVIDAANSLTDASDNASHIRSERVFNEADWADAVRGHEPLSRDQELWVPFAFLQHTLERTGTLATPVAPRHDGDAWQWSFVLSTGATPPPMAQRDAICSAVAQSAPAVLCAHDEAIVGGAMRPRWRLTWRTSGEAIGGDLATPLRALSRVGSRLCLRSAEVTLRSLEIVVRAPTMAALGESLALMTVIAPLRELIMVRAELHGAEVTALLSLPLSRLDATRATLGDDPWPQRCDGHTRVAEDSRGALHARMAILSSTPTSAPRGAIVERSARRFMLTAQDVFGDATIVDHELQRIRVQFQAGRRGRMQWVAIEGGLAVSLEPRGTMPILMPPEPARGRP